MCFFKKTSVRFKGGEVSDASAFERIEVLESTYPLTLWYLSKLEADWVKAPKQL
jgi:hypothetical protein